MSEAPTVAAQLSTLRRDSFVGRAAELADFAVMLSSGSTGFRMVWVYGPGGVGKTYLCTRFVDIARAAGRAGGGARAGAGRHARRRVSRVGLRAAACADPRVAAEAGLRRAWRNAGLRAAEGIAAVGGHLRASGAARGSTAPGGRRPAIPGGVILQGGVSMLAHFAPEVRPPRQLGDGRPAGWYHRSRFAALDDLAVSIPRYGHLAWRVPECWDEIARKLPASRLDHDYGTGRSRRRGRRAARPEGRSGSRTRRSPPVPRAGRPPSPRAGSRSPGRTGAQTLQFTCRNSPAMPGSSSAMSALSRPDAGTCRGSVPRITFRVRRKPSPTCI